MVWTRACYFIPRVVWNIPNIFTCNDHKYEVETTIITLFCKIGITFSIFVPFKLCLKSKLCIIELWWEKSYTWRLMYYLSHLLLMIFHYYSFRYCNTVNPLWYNSFASKPFGTCRNVHIMPNKWAQLQWVFPGEPNPICCAVNSTCWTFLFFVHSLVVLVPLF